MIKEEGLRDWFGKSKSKDGKSGWVNVVTGGTCASDEPGEGTPKCVSSSKRASMTKAERKSAARRKKAADPGQQSKSGAAKPTYVKTDSPRKMKEETFNEARKPGETPKAYADRMKKKYSGGKSKTYDPMKDPNFDHDKAERTRGSMQEAEDKKGKGSGKKDACYNKVKSRYSVWPSAYASGALVKCRKVGAANWGNKSEGMEEFYNLPELTEAQIGALKYSGYEVEVIDEACWKGYEKKGMKTMFGKRYPNCVKKEEKDPFGRPDGKHGGVPKKGGGYDKAYKAIMKKNKELEQKEEVTGGILIQGKEDFTPREIESVDIIKPEPMKGTQLSEMERIKPQVGNMYQVIFGWRGKMMMVKLFFPDAKIPNRQKVSASLDKMYPGSQLRSYSHSIVDYDDPYINVGVDEETHIHEEKEEEKYCRLCEKREPRSKCAYGGKMWDKYSVDNIDDEERGEAASESGITEDVNKEVEARMQADENRKRTHVRNKHRSSRYRQSKYLPANVSARRDRRTNESYSNWRQDMQEDMSGMSQKSGDKRSTESGAGMTAKGVAKYNRRTGGNLKTAVTTPPSKLKPGSKAAGRRKSFCARSRGWTGERGKAARRRWNC